MSGLAMRTTPVTEDEREAARKRLRSVLPHLFLAANAALIEVEGGALQLGVIAKAADGARRITAAFQADTFLRDLEMLVGPLLTRGGKASDKGDLAAAREEPQDFVTWQIGGSGGQIATRIPDLEEAKRRAVEVASRKEDDEPTPVVTIESGEDWTEGTYDPKCPSFAIVRDDQLYLMVSAERRCGHCGADKDQARFDAEFHALRLKHDLLPDDR